MRDLGSRASGVGVRVPTPAPEKNEAMIQSHSFVFICACLLDNLYATISSREVVQC